MFESLQESNEKGIEKDGNHFEKLVKLLWCDNAYRVLFCKVLLNLVLYIYNRKDLENEQGQTITQNVGTPQNKQSDQGGAQSRSLYSGAALSWQKSKRL